MSSNLSNPTRQERKEMRKRKWRTLITALSREARPKRTIPITRMKISNDEWDILMSEYRLHIGEPFIMGNIKRKR